MNTLEIIFGIITVLSLLFTIYTHFKSREFIYPLIEKLRTSRNSFSEFATTSKRITTIIDLKSKSESEKLHMIRQLSRNIEENIWTKLNNIDNGKAWDDKSDKEIFRLIKK